CIFYFFFSSSRRHTSFSRDWSSDVCSSDLHVIRHSSCVMRVACSVLRTSYCVVRARCPWAIRQRWSTKHGTRNTQHASRLTPTQIGRASCRERVGGRREDDRSRN